MSAVGDVHAIACARLTCCWCWLILMLSLWLCVCLRCFLLQLKILEDQLPYLIPAAGEALRGMDHKPVSDLVA
jgi:hypothetical protein